MRHVDVAPSAGLAAALAVVGLVTLAIYPLQKLDPGVSSGVLYVLGVLAVALTWGLALGLLTAAASAVALWAFHTSPAAGFRGAEAEDVVAIVILLVTSVVAALIADRARLRTREAEARLALEAELHRRDAERIRVEEVEASRARVLAAADAERKRVVRDLHDGAQQRLVHTLLTLRLARQALERDDGREEPAAALLDEALDHAQVAIDELRALAHGILPTVLVRGGLRAAVGSLAGRMPVRVDVDVDLDRLEPEVEATAYFVVSEALTNVAKHARARSAQVRAWRGDGALHVEVCDDGRGGARRDGAGLTGLADRLAVLGGALDVRDAGERGTRVAAAIPLDRAGQALALRR